MIQVTVKATSSKPMTMQELNEFTAQAKMHGIGDKATPFVTTSGANSGGSPRAFYTIEVTDTIKEVELR